MANTILTINSQRPKQVIDITEQVQAAIQGTSGLVHILIMHTTAAITTADLDPGTDLDLLDALQSLIPERQWRHPHDPKHTPDHLLSSIVGPDLTVPSQNGQLQLGTWQRIVLIEFNGPRERQVRLDYL